MIHNSPFGGGFDAMFTLVPIFIGIVFVIVIGSIVLKAIRGVSEWSYNNTQPEITQDAKVVSKRMEVSGSREHSSTNYYATFEMPSGERCEFRMSGSDYGLLAEGDTGQICYQGSRYVGFSRSSIRANPVEKTSQTPPEHLVCDYCRSAIPLGSIKCASCGWTWKPQREEANGA